MGVDVYDPWANPEEVKHEYGVDIIGGKNCPPLEEYSAVILAVAHKEFKTLPIVKSNKLVVYDVKAVLEKDKVDARL